MRTDKEKANEFGFAFALAVFGGIMILLSCQSCLAPALLGVKSIKTAGGTKIDFITGADFTVGANGVDTVRDSRGIMPEGGFEQQQPQQPVKY